MHLSSDGVPLAVGISTLAGSVAELARAHVEAREALESLSGRPGVVALPRLARSSTSCCVPTRPRGV